jgi:CO dehydrogenase maturation factor
MCPDDLRRTGRGFLPKKDARRMAITGKGGSGKTMLTATMTRLLAGNPGLSILAIDADSSVSLSYALGVSVTRTVAEVRWQMIEDAAKTRGQDQHIRAMMEEITESGRGFRLLTMGRPEGPGCFCAVNDLLRYGIDTLSKQHDITLIDCEAGPEQVNRRVVNGVDSLVIVTDTSVRGMHAAASIAGVVRKSPEMGRVQVGLVINRFRGDGEQIMRMADEKGLPVLGLIPEDETLADYDARGLALIDLPESCPSVLAVRDIVGKLGLWSPE